MYICSIALTCGSDGHPLSTVNCLPLGNLQVGHIEVLVHVSTGFEIGSSDHANMLVCETIVDAGKTRECIQNCLTPLLI